jgi:hypothetical protein
MALSVIDIIRKYEEARNITAGRLDKRPLKSVSGKVYVNGSIRIRADYSLDQQAHKVKGQRSVIGEDASIEIDGVAMSDPDVDLQGGTSGLKYVVKYILQYADAAGAHEMRLYAYVNVVDLP